METWITSIGVAPVATAFAALCLVIGTERQRWIPAVTGLQTPARGVRSRKEV